MEVPSTSISCPLLESNAQNGGLMVKTNLMKFRYLKCFGFIRVTGQIAFCNPLQLLPIVICR